MKDLRARAHTQLVDWSATMKTRQLTHRIKVIKQAKWVKNIITHNLNKAHTHTHTTEHNIFIVEETRRDVKCAGSLHKNHMISFAPPPYKTKQRTVLVNFM